MTIKTLDSRTARENWRDLLDTATSGLTDVVITRHGKPVTAMIRYEDYAALQDELLRLRAQKLEVYQTMLASEQVLRREWDTPEEDEAWADL
jgi:prevent-host-death family protein